MNIDNNRRTFLRNGLGTLGMFALNSLLRGEAPKDKWQGVVHPLHFAPKAKRVIFLYQAGGPSHLETFDYKPKLAEMSGKGMPESFTTGAFGKSHSQPKDYYDQIITDTKFMTRGQRKAHEAGIDIRAGGHYPLNA